MKLRPLFRARNQLLLALVLGSPHSWYARRGIDMVRPPIRSMSHVRALGQSFTSIRVCAVIGIEFLILELICRSVYKQLFTNTQYLIFHGRQVCCLSSASQVRVRSCFVVVLRKNIYMTAIKRNIVTLISSGFAFRTMAFTEWLFNQCHPIFLSSPRSGRRCG